jgi:hypothetical protein
MYWPAIKIALSACVIAFASWLSKKNPALAGFIIALPLSSLLVLAFSYAEFQDAEKSVTFAKAIFTAIPVSLLFFLPFLLAQKLHLNFWALYGLGVALLAGGYFVHSFIMQHMS